jgi:ABC-2 type transport system permease protein
MTAHPQTPPLVAPLPSIPLRRRLYGFGSIYGKTVRDSRLAFLVMTGLIVGFMFAIGQAFGTAYSTAASRVELTALVESVPPILAGMAGNTVNVDTMGGFLTYKYGPFFAFLAGLWSILALSGTLAGEARRGSLDFVAVAPFGKRRLALEKLLAHVTMLGLSMLLLALSAWVAGTAFGTPELGDGISVVSGLGFAIWVGLIALASGSVAFVLAPILGRGGAAGIAGMVLIGSFVIGNYAPYVPALDTVSSLSWFGWTYDHVPLAGQFDWLSVAAVGIIAVVLLGLGVEVFARRDLGVTTGLPLPGLPRATLGLHGPVGRAAGDQLPLALAWGLGVGVFGFVLAAASQSFTAQLAEQ